MRAQQTFRRLGVALLALAGVAGCDLFEDEESGLSEFTESVIVANGGNFSDQNGFLTVYNPETGAVTNLGDLGGFAQAMALKDGEIYVLLNTFTTGRISVLDIATGALVRQIQGIPSPRGIVFVNESLAAVTNLSSFGPSGPEPAPLTMLNYQTGTIDPAQIEVGIYPEGLASHGGRLYVANNGNLGSGTTLSMIDAQSKALIGAIDLGCDGPNEVFVDPDEDLVIVCEGKTVYNDDFTEIIEQTNAQVVVLDSQTRVVKARIELPTPAGSENGSQTAYLDPLTEELYVIDSDSKTIYRFDTDTHTIGATIDVPDQDDLVGLTAVAYDGLSARLYVARLALGAGGFPDFSAAGAVIILSRTGSFLDRFTVGPAPSHIEFVRAES